MAFTVVFISGSLSAFSHTLTENLKSTDHVNIYTNSVGLKAFLSGKRKQGSLNLEIISLLSEKLNLTSKIQFASTKRVNRALKSEVPSCVFLRLKSNEREKQFTFSLPLELLLTPKLYVHGDNGPIPAAFVNERNELISLSKFFKHGASKPLLLLPTQSLGDELDAMIMGIDQDKKVLVNANNIYDSQMRMFMMNRGYVITFPEALIDKALPEDKTFSYSFAGLEKVFGGRMMCNRNEAVVRFLKTVNTELLQLYTSEEYRQIYRKYSSQKTLATIFDYIDDTLIPRAQLALNR